MASTIEVDLTFPALEILEMAVQIEDIGVRFYSRAAVATDDMDARDVLLGLAAMEEAHRQRFVDLRERFAAYEGAPLESPEFVREYLHSWLDGSVFRRNMDPTELIERGGTLEDILWQAMELEKNSIAFYSGLKAFVKGDDQLVVDEILTEELQHLVELGRAMRAVRRGEDPRATLDTLADE